jgi:hypothetical protein
LYLSYIPNLELVTNSLPNVYGSIKGKKNIFDPRIQIYQSIQQYKLITSGLTPTPTTTGGPTPTPSNTVGVTTTPTLTRTPSSTPPIAGSTLNNFNSIWNSISFTGSGSLANPYANSSNSSINSAGIQFTTVLSGTLRITCSSMYSDYGIDFYKNGVLLGSPPSVGDANSGNGGSYNVNVSIPVSASDVITVGTSSDYYTWSTPINIWIQ